MLAKNERQLGENLLDEGVVDVQALRLSSKEDTCGGRRGCNYDGVGDFGQGFWQYGRRPNDRSDGCSRHCRLE